MNLTNTSFLFRSLLKSLPLLFLFAFSMIWTCENDLNGLSEKPMVVVIPSYNNIDWYQSNLKSILDQDYQNYRVIYIDDCSKDGTGEAVQNFFNQQQQDYSVVFLDLPSDHSIDQSTLLFSHLINQQQNRFILVRNLQRCGALANLYRAIHSCQNNEIVVTVDGDDWLSDNKVLKRLNATYHNQVWFTHGTLKEYPWGHVAWCEPIKEEAFETRNYRAFKCPSHMRTFYAGLFKKIKLADFLYEGQFFPMAWDMAIMFPLVEMTGRRHAFVAEVNYIYNMANQINDNKVNAHLQRELDYYIRHQPPYDELDDLELEHTITPSL